MDGHRPRHRRLRRRLLVAQLSRQLPVTQLDRRPFANGWWWVTMPSCDSDRPAHNLGLTSWPGVESEAAHNRLRQLGAMRPRSFIAAPHPCPRSCADRAARRVGPVVSRDAAHRQRVPAPVRRQSAAHVALRPRVAGLLDVNDAAVAVRVSRDGSGHADHRPRVSGDPGAIGCGRRPHRRRSHQPMESAVHRPRSPSSTT
jgi:hypothetical protein